MHVPPLLLASCWTLIIMSGLGGKKHFSSADTVLTHPLFFLSLSRSCPAVLPVFFLFFCGLGPKFTSSFMQMPKRSQQRGWAAWFLRRERVYSPSASIGFYYQLISHLCRKSHNGKMPKSAGRQYWDCAYSLKSLAVYSIPQDFFFCFVLHV